MNWINYKAPDKNIPQFHKVFEFTLVNNKVNKNTFILSVCDFIPLLGILFKTANNIYRELCFGFTENEAALKFKRVQQSVKQRQAFKQQ